MLLLFSLGVVLWSFLEASFWWVAPDIAISIAYLHFPTYWKRFLLLALLGAFLGSLLTYMWAYHAPASWLHYVTGMPFHSEKNIQYVKATLNSDYLSIVKGAWGGVPYKLFFGLAPLQHIAFTTLITIGLLSRSIRFVFVLGVTWLIRYYLKPWSVLHPAKLSLILLFIWATMIALFDMAINQVFL